MMITIIIIIIIIIIITITITHFNALIQQLQEPITESAQENNNSNNANIDFGNKHLRVVEINKSRKKERMKERKKGRASNGDRLGR
jgi:predicted Holliday junction resolvase-like endonuclease